MGLGWNADLPLIRPSAPFKGKVRIEMETLDILRNGVPASNDNLTLSKLYNALESLRGGRLLTAYERDMHDSGVVTLTLRERPIQMPRQRPGFPSQRNLGLRAVKEALNPALQSLGVSAPPLPLLAFVFCDSSIDRYRPPTSECRPDALSV
jgi:hypothetical protein